MLRKRNSYFLFLLFLFVQLVSFGQREISGTVTSESDKVPIEGAVIRVKGTSVVTATNQDGKYTINVPAGKDTLVFSFTMMLTQEIKLGASNVVDVWLKDESDELDEVVVTALGIKRDERSLGYAVSNMDGDAIRQSNQTNVVNALGGKIAGANVTQASGAAGGSSRITLRGFTSLTGNNEALIVIDGVKVNNEELNSEETTEGVNYSNRGIDINPDDIESVSVLKGGAASALYGIDGANGVVLITTKKGKASSDGNKFAVSFNSSFGISQVNRLPQLQDKFAQGDY